MKKNDDFTIYIILLISENWFEYLGALLCVPHTFFKTFFAINCCRLQIKST